MSDRRKGHKPSEHHIVSSAHLASPEAWQLSEFEYGLIVCHNAFNRWITRCMGAAGGAEFNPLEVLVLHNVNHREREKRLVDICFVLHIEDQHTVNYALKKLVKAGLISGQKRGKEIFYTTTYEGRELCELYRQVREQCLVTARRALACSDEDLAETAALLRLFSGVYDQASRAVSSL